MTSFNPTSGIGSEPITPPPGVTFENADQEQVYRAALEFERFFVQQLLKPMEGAGSMFGEEGGSGSTGGYEDLAHDQLTQAVLDGGGLGLAATLYGQLADAVGVAGAAAPSGKQGPA